MKFKLLVKTFLHIRTSLAYLGIIVCLGNFAKINAYTQTSCLPYKNDQKCPQNNWFPIFYKI